MHTHIRTYVQCAALLQSVAVRRSVSQCVVVCCSVLQSHDCSDSLSRQICAHTTFLHTRKVLQCIAVCCSVLVVQTHVKTAGSTHIFKHACRVLQGVAVCCSVLRSVAVHCRVLSMQTCFAQHTATRCTTHHGRKLWWCVQWRVFHAQHYNTLQHAATRCTTHHGRKLCWCVTGRVLHAQQYYTLQQVLHPP